MKQLNIGDRVSITMMNHRSFGRMATITDFGLKGGIYVLIDGEELEIYLPWGWKSV